MKFFLWYEQISFLVEQAIFLVDAIKNSDWTFFITSTKKLFSQLFNQSLLVHIQIEIQLIRPNVFSVYCIFSVVVVNFQ